MPLSSRLHPSPSIPVHYHTIQGLDDPQRWRTDFSDVYQSEATPTLRGLTWLSSLGNHDIITGA